ncbi:class I SAM-dependent methyltransferase [Vallitalea okinawensis]|uniref:class I SAM-dependent methyltransferase n=1 Tax=Vallitalea okinawensis TaxID=2078660 RepID=UPI000CFBE1FE|nr:class I SAM-dependent methyltransferase [Vallitalea okinawensis]
MQNKFDIQGRVKEQYKNSCNLSARLNLHSFNTNKLDWHVWFFEKMDIPENSKILELGCGNGVLWQVNKQAVKENWDITLSDFSEGMLQDSKQNISIEKVKFEIIDIQEIPYEDESFDIIIARHMLYHVPDIDKALSEVKRVLKPNGKFYVSTNGKGHMQELIELVKKYDKYINFNPSKFADKFGIENGNEMLKQYFNNVSAENFDGQIVVHKAEPVVSYVTSIISAKECLSNEQELESFYKYIEKEIDKKGTFSITTKVGMFIVTKL